jgi:hypothetical protein
MSICALRYGRINTKKRIVSSMFLKLTIEEEQIYRILFVQTANLFEKFPGLVPGFFKFGDEFNLFANRILINQRNSKKWHQSGGAFELLSHPAKYGFLGNNFTVFKSIEFIVIYLKRFEKILD